MSRTKTPPCDQYSVTTSPSITTTSTGTSCYPWRITDTTSGGTISSSTTHAVTMPRMIERTAEVDAEVTDVGQIRMGAPLNKVANKQLVDDLVKEMTHDLRDVICDLCQPEIISYTDNATMEKRYRVRVTLSFGGVVRVR